MKPLNTVLSTLLLAAMALGSAAAQQQGATNKAANPKQEALDRAGSALGHTPASFIENRGQWSAEARYLARLDGLDLWVTNRGIVYDIHTPGLPAPAAEPLADPPKAAKERAGHVVRMNFVGTAGASASGLEKLPTTYNYFIGNDRSKWAAGVPSYGEARIANLYRGVDVALYFDSGRPRYDLILAPGADPSAIRVAYEGATSLAVNKEGELEIGTSAGTLTQTGLLAYQMIDGRKQRVPCHFAFDRGDGAGSTTVGFRLGVYDRSKPLVIDPLILGTYLSSSAYSRGYDIALDAGANIYVTGYTGFPNFPTSAGAYQTTLGPSSIDAFVSKLDSTGTTLLYSTFLGGTTDDAGTALAVDGAGAIYLTGYTYSTDFPLANAYDDTHNGSRDVFVAKLDPFQGTPSSQLVYSTYVGGNRDDWGMGIAVKSGSAFVTGYSNSTAFPTVNGYQPTPGLASGQPSGDAIIFRLGPTGSSLLASTYLGGASNKDVGYAIGLDNTGNVYICGSTVSNNFPTAGTPIYDNTANGGTDAFVSKLDPGLSTLLYSTYLGGAGEDRASGIAVDASGNAYLTGMAASGFPTTAGSFKATYNGGENDIFVAKMTTLGSMAYSTYIGGNNDEWGTDITIDGGGNAYVTGITRAQNFPATANGLQPVLKGIDFDAFIAEVNPAGSGLLYASYLGGTGGDTAMGIALSQAGFVHITGTTFSNNFPTTPGAYLTNGVGGIFVAKVGIMRMTAPSGGEVWCAGDAATIRWTGSAPNGAYDLYISADSGRTFTSIAFNVPGTSYDWFIPRSMQAGIDYRVKVIASNGTEADLSNRITINAPPIITAQPSSVTTSAGSSANFIAGASGTPAPTIKWQKLAEDGWHDIAGETGNTLKLASVAASQSGTYYRAVFTNSCGVTATDSALLTVPSVLLDGPNGGEQFCGGSTQTITWTAPADGGPATLLYSSDGGASWNLIVNGATGGSYSWKVPDVASTNFLVRVQLGGGSPQDVSDRTFTVNRAARVTKQPTDTTVLMGDDASFLAVADGPPSPLIQWQVNKGTGWEEIDGATAGTLTLKGLEIGQNGYRYRAIFMNPCGGDTTAEALLTVKVEPGSGVDDDRASNDRSFGLALLPNPVRGSTAEIRCTIPRAGHAELRVVDMAGRVVARPFDGVLTQGEHRIALDASALRPGAYTCILLFENGRRSAVKMRVVR